jgi:hypothetical protein
MQTSLLVKYFHHIFTLNKRERCEDPQFVAIMRHAFSSKVKSVAENDMEAEILGLVMVVRFLVAIRFLLGDSWLEASASASGNNGT